MSSRSSRKPQPNREIKDPLLRLVRAGADREPAPSRLRKGARKYDEPARRGGLLGLLQLLGPGLVTGASDDDPSGIGTYSQVGGQFGLGVLWTALFTFPLMLAVQELCARIALETGVGLGAALRRKFPTGLVGVCIVALLVANTINLGADLGAVAAGGSLLSRGLLPTLWLVAPAAVLILGLQLFVSYRLIFDIFKWLTLALFAYVVTAVLARPPALAVLRATFVPHLELSKEFLLALVAILGTTISPYLFFWQASSEIDQGVHSDDLRGARADIAIGMFFSQVVMYSIILTSATVLHAHGKTDIQTADQAAQALSPFLGPFAVVAFALGMIGTGLLAVPILSASGAYAVKEFFGFEGALGSWPWYRPTFYLVIVTSTLLGVLMNLLHVDPVRALFYSAALNGIVAPPLMALIVLLGSDRQQMGARASGRLSRALTWAATALMAAAAAGFLVSLVPSLRV